MENLLDWQALVFWGAFAAFSFRRPGDLNAYACFWDCHLLDGHFRDGRGRGGHFRGDRGRGGHFRGHRGCGGHFRGNRGRGGGFYAFGLHDAFDHVSSFENAFGFGGACVCLHLGNEVEQQEVH